MTYLSNHYCPVCEQETIYDNDRCLQCHTALSDEPKELMSEAEKMIHMYTAVNKDTDERDLQRLTVEELDTADHRSPMVLKYIKDGDTCWYQTKEELLFNYMTRDWC